jgi:hypothetical protein
MPTVTAAPISPLSRLRAKLPPLPRPTAKDRLRWKKIAADKSPILITDQAPDMSKIVPGLIECAPPASFLIDTRLAKWFDSHGGTRAVVEALRSYKRAHSNKHSKNKSRQRK